jgi:hypothetical protein
MYVCMYCAVNVIYSLSEGGTHLRVHAHSDLNLFDYVNHGIYRNTFYFIKHVQDMRVWRHDDKSHITVMRPTSYNSPRER